MNLLKDTWMPVIRRDGTRDTIAVIQLLDAYQNNPVMDIIAYRPDFHNAIFQLLIGLVQVAALPEDDEHWSELYYSPWSAEEFKEKVLQYADCFEIDANGPAFMQDYSLTEGGKEETLGNLFINLPANEHFSTLDDSGVKSEPQQINPYWAAVALYTLQTFAPSGGRGHRVGLRGGGPLTTILLPGSEDGTLWEKIWLNIIAKEEIKNLTGDSEKTGVADMFPWMKPTKISEEKGTELYADECHPFHMYFGMPRRIRLIFENEPGVCDITGLPSETVVKKYITRHSGNNYSGVWFHPLNAYAHNPKKPDEAPYSKKPTSGGVTYRYWLGLVVESEDTFPASVVKRSQESAYRREVIRKQGVVLWAAGYNMNNMKAECWYDSRMPVYPLEKSDEQKVSAFVQKLIDSSKQLAAEVRSKVKSAWFDSPKDVKGDLSHIEAAFWQITESDFYRVLEKVVQDPGSDTVKSEMAKKWMVILRERVYSLFDEWALAQQEDGLDMKRVVRARNNLGKSINKVTKPLKELIID